MKKPTPAVTAENVIHHYHHAAEAKEGFKREVLIVSATKTIGLSSDNPKESMDFLCEKSLELLRRVKGSDYDEETKQ